MKVEDMLHIPPTNPEDEYEMKRVTKTVIEELDKEGLDLTPHERYREIWHRVYDAMMASPVDETLVEKFGEPETPQDKAELLVIEALGSPPAKALKLAKQAQKLDPLNCDPYYLLGFHSNDDKVNKENLEKGYKAAKQLLGEDFITEQKKPENQEKDYWAMLKLRPLIRTSHELSKVYFKLGEDQKAMEVMEEMLELSPPDPQGARHRLSALLLKYQRYNDFKKLYDEYKYLKDGTLAFDYVLYLYLTEGKTDKTREALFRADAINTFIILYILHEEEEESLGRYSAGSPEEAAFYCNFGIPNWDRTLGAAEWVFSEL